MAGHPESAARDADGRKFRKGATGHEGRCCRCARSTLRPCNGRKPPERRTISGIATTSKRRRPCQCTPYLFFDGRCEEAIEFYKKTLGAKVEMMMRFKEAPGPRRQARSARQREQDHARVLSHRRRARDGVRRHAPRASRNSRASRSPLNAKDEAEADRMFAALADGGQVQMPLGKTFFAKRFGMVADKFGVGWMVIVEH